MKIVFALELRIMIPRLSFAILNFYSLVLYVVKFILLSIVLN